jgi:hypothetical protein
MFPQSVPFPDHVDENQKLSMIGKGLSCLAVDALLPNLSRFKTKRQWLPSFSYRPGARHIDTTNDLLS